MTVSAELTLGHTHGLTGGQECKSGGGTGCDLQLLSLCIAIVNFIQEKISGFHGILMFWLEGSYIYIKAPERS